MKTPVIRDIDDLRGEALLRRVISEQFQNANPASRLLLSESAIDRATVKDVLQFALAAAVEYGVIIPTAGTGAPIGAAAETIIDSLFTAESVSGAIKTVGDAKSIAGEYASLFKSAYSSYDPGNWKSYYSKLIRLIQRVLADFEKVGRKVDDVVAEIKEAIQEMIASLMQPVKKSIQLVIPDATVGLAAAKAIEAGLQALAEKPYSAVTAAVQEIDILSKFVKNPTMAINFFDKLIEKLVKFMREVAASIEDSGDKESNEDSSTATQLITKLVALSPTGQFAALIKKGLAPKLLTQAADMLEGFTPKFLELLDKVLKVVMPYMFTCLALFQIFVTGDYMTEDEKKAAKEKPGQKEKEKLEDSHIRLGARLKGSTQSANEARLRKLIRLQAETKNRKFPRLGR